MNTTHEHDPEQLVWACLARYALNTLSVYRLEVHDHKPRARMTILATGRIEGYQGAARVLARMFGIEHAEVERRLGWSLSGMPLSGAEHLSAHDPGDRFARLRAASEVA